MITYHEIPRTRYHRRHTKPHWLDTSRNFQQEKPRVDWQPYMLDKVRDSANPDHVVTFANTAMRDKWLTAQYPNRTKKRELARQAYSAINGRSQ